MYDELISLMSVKGGVVSIDGFQPGAPMVTASAGAAATALEVRDIRSGYAGADVLHGVSVSVPKGVVAAVIGPNGAGKTTLLRTIAGFVRVHGGTIEMAGTDLSRMPPTDRAALGLCDIPEGRGIFGSLTVRENIRLFAPRSQQRAAVERVADEIPRLTRLLSRTAGTLSGGEQQILALSRAYVTSPSVILIDEVSLGLAPIVVDEVFAMLSDLRKRGTAMLLVEQYVQRALDLADTVCVLNRGRVVFSGSVEQARGVDLHAHYFQTVNQPDQHTSTANGGN
jgi:branched-chain amino acid transport system ATP-binding protein